MSTSNRICLVLGIITLLFFGSALLFFRSPFGLDSYYRWGLFAGGGWIASSGILRHRRLLVIAHTTLSCCAVIGLYPFEQWARYSLNPTAGDHYVFLNYLIDDPLLGQRVPPGAWGHDENGFRNPRVPSHAEIVAIGDSQTWGYNAARSETWPAVLDHLTGQGVYNMALGGYGPVEYEVLAADALQRLSPSVIVIGLYLGNDLYDAYQAVYTRAAFAGQRDPQAAPDLLADTIGPQADQFLDRADLPYRSPDRPLLNTEFTLTYRLLGLNRDEPRIREGLRLTLAALDQIDAQARTAGVRLVVLLLPTKETVYAGLAGESTSPDYQRLIAMERAARQSLIAHLDARGIDYFDARPALTAALETGTAVYLTTADGHPSPAGYAVIAAALRDALD